MIKASLILVYTDEKSFQEGSWLLMFDLLIAITIPFADELKHSHSYSDIRALCSLTNNSHNEITIILKPKSLRITIFKKKFTTAFFYHLLIFSLTTIGHPTPIIPQKKIILYLLSKKSHLPIRNKNN